MLVAVALPSHVFTWALVVGSKFVPLPLRRFSARRAVRSPAVIDELPEFFHQPKVFAAQLPPRQALPNEQLNPLQLAGLVGSPNEPGGSGELGQVSGVVAIVPGGCTSVTIRLVPGVSGKL